MSKKQKQVEEDAEKQLQALVDQGEMHVIFSMLNDEQVRILAEDWNEGKPDEEKPLERGDPVEVTVHGKVKTGIVSHIAAQSGIVFVQYPTGRVQWFHPESVRLIGGKK